MDLLNQHCTLVHAKISIQAAIMEHPYEFSLINPHGM